MARRIEEPDDSLAQWLEHVKPSTAIFCRAEVREPWGFRIGGREAATFHIFTEGRGLLEVEGVRGSIAVAEGDVVLLPNGAAHALRDAPTTPLPTLEAAVGAGSVDGKHVSFGGDGPGAVMVCGTCSLGLPGVDPPRTLLGPLVTHRLEPALLQVVAREADGLASGSEAVLQHLLALIVLQALRANLVERSQAELRAMLSPRIAQAVAYIHANLSEELRIADLCAHVAMSRTAFSDQFRRALGVSPMAYVRLARLARAADLLSGSSVSLQRIARAIGYSSDSAFSRAFRARYGTSPGAFRSPDSPDPAGPREG